MWKLVLENLKRNKIMETALQIFSVISICLAVGATWIGEIDRATWFLVWAFYFKYLSDKRKTI